MHTSGYSLLDSLAFWLYCGTIHHCFHPLRIFVIIRTSCSTQIESWKLFCLVLNKLKWVAQITKKQEKTHNERTGKLNQNNSIEYETLFFSPFSLNRHTDIAEDRLRGKHMKCHLLLFVFSLLEFLVKLIFPWHSRSYCWLRDVGRKTQANRLLLLFDSFIFRFLSLSFSLSVFLSLSLAIRMPNTNAFFIDDCVYFLLFICLSPDFFQFSQCFRLPFSLRSNSFGYTFVFRSKKNFYNNNHNHGIGNPNKCQQLCESI